MKLEVMQLYMPSIFSLFSEFPKYSDNHQFLTFSEFLVG